MILSMILLCVGVVLLFYLVAADRISKRISKQSEENLLRSAFYAQAFNIPGSQKFKSEYLDDEIEEVEEPDEIDEPDEDELEDEPAPNSTSSSLPAYVSDAFASLHLEPSTNLTRAVVMSAWRKQVRKVHSDKNSNAKTDDFETVMAARDIVLKFFNKE